MRNIVFFVSTAIIYTIVPLLINKFVYRSNSDENEPNVLKYPKICLIVGVGGSFFILTAYALAAMQGFDNVLETVFLTGFSLIFFILMDWFFLQSLNWRLIIDNDFLIHRNFLGITRKYSYNEISKIYACYNRRYGTIEKYKICVGNRKITIECLVINFANFERLMKKAFKKANLKIVFGENNSKK